MTIALLLDLDNFHPDLAEFGLLSVTARSAQDWERGRRRASPASVARVSRLFEEHAKFLEVRA